MMQEPINYKFFTLRSERLNKYYILLSKLIALFENRKN